MTTAAKWAWRICTPLLVAWLCTTNGGCSPQPHVGASDGSAIAAP